MNLPINDEDCSNVNEGIIDVKECFKNQIFKINPIKFQNQAKLICMQSENGPCPLIAILNCLLLRGEIELEPNSEYLTGEEMANRIFNYILEKDNDGDVDVIIEHFNELQTGLMVNVRFSNVSDFEGCNRLHIFDFLNIKLYHGWLMDPALTPDYEKLKSYTYDQAAEDVVQDNDTLSLESKIYLRDFLNSNQLTYPGLCQLNETMKENELAILFHNNHFSVIYKMGFVYLLSTDIGYSFEPGMVWQCLNSVTGDTEPVDEEFKPAQSNYNNTVIEDPDLELAKKLAIDDDYNLAMVLQEKENEEIIEQTSRNQDLMNRSIIKDNEVRSNVRKSTTRDKCLNERPRNDFCILL